MLESKRKSGRVSKLETEMYSLHEKCILKTLFSPGSTRHLVRLQLPKKATVHVYHMALERTDGMQLIVLPGTHKLAKNVNVTWFYYNK